MGFTTKLLDILSINATAAKDYIDKLLETKQNKLTFDDAPKKGSTNPVTSDGIRKAIDTATPNIDFSNYPTKNGTGATGTWPISISGAATKASQDSNGKVITDTYLKKAGDTATGDITAPNFIGNLKGNADNATRATNADTVDGYHENSFLRYRGDAAATGEDTLWNQIGIKEYNNVLPESLTGTYTYGAVVSFPSQNNRLDLWYDCYASNTGTGLYYRTGWANEKKAWARLLDSNNYTNWAPTKIGTGASGTWGINITGNAATATTTDNAKKLGGYALNTESTGGHFGTIPKVGTDGVMEVGKYIDWHSHNGGSADYTSRWEAQNNGTVTVGTINGTLNGNAATATSATTAGNVSGKIYYSSESPSVATDKLFTVKEAHGNDDNVPNNGLVIQTGPHGVNYNGKLYITGNGNDGVWVGGVSNGKKVDWTRLVENKGTWNISISGTALNIPTSDVGGNIWIA